MHLGPGAFGLSQHFPPRLLGTWEREGGKVRLLSGRLPPGNQLETKRLEPYFCHSGRLSPAGDFQVSLGPVNRKLSLWAHEQGLTEIQGKLSRSIRHKPSPRPGFRPGNPSRCLSNLPDFPLIFPAHLQEAWSSGRTLSPAVQIKLLALQVAEWKG